MASSATDLDIFKFGTTKIIVALPDEIDDETATLTIRYLLNTVGTNAEKLEILVDGIYDHVTSQRNTTAMTGLMSHLLQFVSTDIAAVVSSPKDVRKSVASQFWNFRSFEVILELWRKQEAPEGNFFVLDKVLFHILINTSKADHLFEPQKQRCSKLSDLNWIRTSLSEA